MIALSDLVVQHSLVTVDAGRELVHLQELVRTNDALFDRVCGYSSIIQGPHPFTRHLVPLRRSIARVVSDSGKRKSPFLTEPK